MNQSAAVKNFVERWKDKGYEKGETQQFWIDFLQSAFEVQNITEFIKFEQQINGKFIDALIPATNVLIEQKSSGKNLDDAFNQAKFYDNELPYNKKSRWIVTCDFQRFQIYDMNSPKNLPKIILLSEMTKRLDELKFLIEPEIDPIVKISLQAGEIVQKIYDSMLASYKNITPEILTSLNKLCVRLVFCLYAEDAGIFKLNQFHDYLNKCGSAFARQGLIELFKVLDTPLNQRDENLDDILADFPYVNGDLFKEIVEVPKLTNEILYYILAKPENFSWSMISPTIFGSVFESTLNPNVRRGAGMHYTSIENIHKVIDPLFLNELYAEFYSIVGGNGQQIKDATLSFFSPPSTAHINRLLRPQGSCEPVELKKQTHSKLSDKAKRKRLLEFQNKLASLKFLDPACGSGNFLTETYLSLRRLENEVIKELIGAQIKLGELDNPIKVSISQFFGIEINDFAVAVAKTALWISESQMMIETEEIIHKELDFLPLKTSATIIEDNALKIDWPKTDFIMGNPPFVGHQWRSESQVEDMKIVFHDQPKHGKLDYVCAWYKKAADFIKGTQIQCAFVSTNSICQGESVATMWQPLFNAGVKINFAYRSFKWQSESTDMAQVHCVIVGFSMIDTPKKIFDGEWHEAQNINGYLLDAPNIFIKSRGEAPKGLPKMTKGSQPTDGGNLILSAEERDMLIKKYPITAEFIRQYVGAEEFINNKIRYCLWLVDVEPSKYRNIKFIMDRLDKVAEARLKSPTESVRAAADTPYLFTQIRQPDTNYLAIPEVSSENRKYIPMEYMSPIVIVSNRMRILPNANLYIFGVLISKVHMAWMRVVCGRLEMRYLYSPAIYNNFPFCSPTPQQKSLIESTAKKILDIRKNYPTSSLADLYNKRTMPKDLQKAHYQNDVAVMSAYGFDKNLSEAEIVAELMKLYQQLI